MQSHVVFAALLGGHDDDAVDNFVDAFGRRAEYIRYGLNAATMAVEIAGPMRGTVIGF